MLLIAIFFGGFNMSIKKILALLLSVIAVFSLIACQGGENEDVSETTTAVSETEEVTYTVPADAAESVTDSSVEASETTTEELTTENLTDDPAAWSAEQVVEAYKNAAKKSHSTAKSSKNVEIKNISVNGSEIKFVAPIMSKLIANNTEDEDGITGGYNNLTASDVASAKAYKSGNNVVVEMVMREQVSGAAEGEFDGTVGHAIKTVGDISVVTNQLKDLGLPLDFPEKNIKIYYTKPVVKVLINSNGEIVNGTWRYTVEIRLNDYKAFGKPVETTSVIMDNEITVSGGFKA